MRHMLRNLIGFGEGWFHTAPTIAIIFNPYLRCRSIQLQNAINMHNVPKVKNTGMTIWMIASINRASVITFIFPLLPALFSCTPLHQLGNYSTILHVAH